MNNALIFLALCFIAMIVICEIEEYFFNKEMKDQDNEQ